MYSSSHTVNSKRLPIGFRVFALAVLLLVWGNVFAQGPPCKTKMSELARAPELKGFWLGMTTDQVKARAPRIVFGPTDKLGASKTTINPAFDPRTDQSSFQDTRTVSLDFLDGHLVSLWIGYDPSFKWATVAEFVAGISRSLALPNSWSPWKSRGQQMSCADFQLTVSLIAGSPSFRLLDQVADDILAARRAAQEEETPTDEESAESTEFVGDSHVKIYYPASCQGAKEIGEPDRIIFKTRAEADKAGYKPAKDCD